MNELAKVFYALLGGAIGASLTGYFVVTSMEERLGDIVDEVRSASMFATHTDLSHYNMAILLAEAQLEALSKGDKEQILRNTCLGLNSESVITPVTGADSEIEYYVALAEKKRKLIEKLQAELGGTCLKGGGPF